MIPARREIPKSWELSGREKFEAIWEGGNGNFPLNIPGPGESFHDGCSECRLVPGGGPADHPASHWGEASHAGAHQVGHTQEECVPLEERAPL